MLQPRNRVALARWRGTGLTGLVSARAGNSSRAWEIDGLYRSAADLPCAREDAPDANGVKHWNDSTEASADFLALLEEMFQAAGARSAERMFLRLRSGEPLVPLIRRSGFVPCYSETLLEGPGAPESKDWAHLERADNPDAGLRNRMPADDYGLFQLYCASVPLRVRQALGLTFDQWQDACGVGCGGIAVNRPQEWVAEQSDRLVGWVRIVGRGDCAEAELMAHPDRPDQLFRLVDLARSRAPRLRWLVPDYEPALRERLYTRDFVNKAEYTMLVKMIAVPTAQCGMAPVEA